MLGAIDRVKYGYHSLVRVPSPAAAALSCVLHGSEVALDRVLAQVGRGVAALGDEAANPSRLALLPRRRRTRSSIARKLVRLLGRRRGLCAAGLLIVDVRARRLRHRQRAHSTRRRTVSPFMLASLSLLSRPPPPVVSRFSCVRSDPESPCIAPARQELTWALEDLQHGQHDPKRVGNEHKRLVEEKEQGGFLKCGLLSRSPSR